MGFFVKVSCLLNMIEFNKSTEMIQLDINFGVEFMID